MEKMNLKVIVPEVDKNEFVYFAKGICFTDEDVIKVMISWFHEVYESYDSEDPEAYNTEIQEKEAMLGRFREANEDNKPVMDYYNKHLND